MATTKTPMYYGGTGGVPPSLPVASGSKVVLSGLYTDRHGHVEAVFQVDDQDSPWHDHEVSDSPGGTGIRDAELADHIRFDSHEEHLVYQQALTAHHLGNIAASLGNMEGRR